MNWFCCYCRCCCGVHIECICMMISLGGCRCMVNPNVAELTSHTHPCKHSMQLIEEMNKQAHKRKTENVNRCLNVHLPKKCASWNNPPPPVAAAAAYVLAKHLAFLHSLFVFGSFLPSIFSIKELSRCLVPFVFHSLQHFTVLLLHFRKN